MSVKKINKSQEFQEFKKDLAEDLSQFLFDNNIDQEKAVQEKSKALAELDKLIKQELSYSQILSTIKTKVTKNIKKENKPEELVENIEQSESIEYLESDITRSAHLLDLRKSIEPANKKRINFSKHKNNFKNLVNKIEKSRTRIKEERNNTFSLPKLNLSMAFSKSLVFALVVAIILLPIRGMVLIGQIQENKSKILDFGQEGLISLQSGVISASENSYNDAQDNFENALENFNQAQAVLDKYQKWMLNVASLMPVIGKPISLSRNMLAVATNISEAATLLSQESQKQANPTEYISLINKQISKTLPYLEAANKDLDGISTKNLPNDLQNYFHSLKEYLPTTIENLKELSSIFSVIAELLGHQTEKRYIVLFQNNNELRATGGFIGSYALFDVYQGKIINIEVPKGGAYDLEAGQTVKLRAPEALTLINPNFNIWDANWWYDFPTSAKKIVWFYEQASDSSIDGVISINADVLAELLLVLGPVTLEDYNMTINNQNVFDILQTEVELNYNKELNQPKAVITDLVPLILDKLLSNTDKQTAIISVMAKSLANKDIQIYSKEINLQQSLVDFAWAGQMSAYSRDYLAVINTNIAGGKTDKNIYQTIDHQAIIDQNGDIINTVRITRTNHTEEDYLFTGIYGGNASYLRVYVPLGSEFIEAIGFDKIPDNYFSEDINAQIDKDLAKEEIKMIDNVSATEIYTSLNKTVFANWITLASGETKTVSLKYKLPFSLNLGNPLVNTWKQKIFKKDLNLDNYSLVIQAQSGFKNNVFNSSIILPDNVKIVFNNSSNNESINIVDNLLTYSKKLIQDQYFGFILANK